MKIDIPKTDKIELKAETSIKKFEPNAYTKKYLQSHFCEVIELTFDECYRIYERYENSFITSEIEKILSIIENKTYSSKEVKKLSIIIAKKSILIEKSLSQSRKSRAGSTFEIIMKRLLLKLGIKSEKVNKEDKKKGLRRIDLVVPDVATALNSPDIAQFLSLKTSLKDRWKLVVEDQRLGQRTHLLTLLQKECLTDGVVEKISDKGILLYIPDKIKIKKFSNDERVRSLSELPERLI